jgi:hypothetical protein
MWLSGIWLVFQIIFYILIGAGTIIWAVFGAAWMVTHATEHPTNCECPECSRARLRAWKRRHAGDGVIPRANEPYDKGSWWIDDKAKAFPHAGEWLSTLELRENMRVLGKDRGTVYRVEVISSRSYGFAIVLINDLTQKRSWVQISTATAHHKIWLVRQSRRGQ